MYNRILNLLKILAFFEYSMALRVQRSQYVYHFSLEIIILGYLAFVF